MKDGDGAQLPYLDEITYQPIPDSNSRYTALSAGDVDMEHDSAAQTIQQIRDAAEDAKRSTW